MNVIRKLSQLNDGDKFRIITGIDGLQFMSHEYTYSHRGDLVLWVYESGAKIALKNDYMFQVRLELPEEDGERIYIDSLQNPSTDISPKTLAVRKTDPVFGALWYYFSPSMEPCKVSADRIDEWRPVTITTE